MKKSMTMFICLLALLGNCTKLSSDGYIDIQTTKGHVVVKLYEQTPKHKANFIKLAADGFYDGLLFHRVIQNFMIQGGDPDSKGAAAGKVLGQGGPGYTIEAEFNDSLIHKKGALAAARQGDQVNPEKRSSGSQFYIVQGKTYSEEEITALEERQTQILKQALIRKMFEEHREELQKFKEDSNETAYNQLVQELIVKGQEEAKSVKPVQYTDEQKNIYATMGGTPHLDKNYTVFGETIFGLDVLDAIAQVKCDRQNRPLEDVKIIKMTVLSEKKAQKLIKQLTAEADQE